MIHTSSVQKSSAFYSPAHPTSVYPGAVGESVQRAFLEQLLKVTSHSRADLSSVCSHQSEVVPKHREASECRGLSVVVSHQGSVSCA